MGTWAGAVVVVVVIVVVVVAAVDAASTPPRQHAKKQINRSYRLIVMFKFFRTSVLYSRAEEHTF